MLLKTEITPNEKQKECIENIEGKYLVLAGPGTGKTFSVVERIKNMLKNGINPQKILCLTYSEAAANEMKNKIARSFDKIDIGINIYTYHSFCNEIISQNPEIFELSENYRIITETNSKQFLKEVIDESNPIAYRNSKNDPYVYLKIIYQKIKEIKRYNLKKEDYFKNINEHPDWMEVIRKLNEEKSELLKIENKNSKQLKRLEKIENLIEDKLLDIEKAKEIWGFFELYKNKMEQNQYIDFDDMIGFVLEKFENNPAFLDMIANKYEYILVDEYQDTNKSQNKIIFLLTHALKSQNVFVVGDDDQIIYSFQGACLDTIENFLKEFPDTKVICLNENMRSTQNILDIARVISKEDSKRLEINPEFKNYNIDKNLISKNTLLKEKNNKVRLTKYFNIEQEYQDIVDEIENIINSANSPLDLSQIAILAKTHDELQNFAQLLKNKNIPFEVKDGKSIFQSKSSLVLYYYFQILVNPELYCDKFLKLLLLPPFNLNPKDYQKLYEQKSTNKTFIDSMREIQDFIEKEKIEKFLKIYDELKFYSSLETLRNIVLEIVAKTGIFDYFVNNEINSVENIAGIKKITDIAREFADVENKTSLEDFVEYLEMIEQDRELDVLIDKPPIAQNAIQLITYHSSKGREFEIVYMPTLQASKWDKTRDSFKPTIPVNKKDYKDDEYWKKYRLSDKIKTMYVGMTRAKHTLRLSYVENYGKTTQPCEWLLKAQDLMELRDFSEYNLENHNNLLKKSLQKRPYDYRRDFEELIKTKIKDKYYSPTSINEYLTCPRKFLYSQIFDFNLKSANADAMYYGSAVHNALEFAVKSALKDKFYPKKEEFIGCFKKELSKLPISDKIQREILTTRGENELSNYYNILLLTSVESIYDAEFKLKAELDGVNFVGVIDKIEKNEDGSFTIIDYKTGSKKSPSKIEPGEEYENYYNQICLYKYYFEKIENKKVTKTKFIFLIDPANPVEKIFTQDETNQVIEKFKSAIKNIENCNFEPIEDKTKCKYCSFKDYCGLDVV